MRLDLDFLRAMLIAVEDHEEPATDIDLITEAMGFGEGIGFADDATQNKLIHHLQILTDDGLIVATDGGDNGIEYTSDRDCVVSAVPLRMTSAGHKFIDALRNEEVWPRVQALAKQSGMSSLASLQTMAFAMLQAWIASKAGLS